VSGYIAVFVIAIYTALSCACWFVARVTQPLLSVGALAADNDQLTWDVTKEPWKQASILACAPMYSRVCQTEKGAQSDTKCNTSELVAWLVDFRNATIQFIAPTGNQHQTIVAMNWTYHGQTMSTGRLEGSSSDISILGSGDTLLRFSYIRTKLGVDLIGTRFDAITFNGERYATYEQGTRCTAEAKP